MPWSHPVVDARTRLPAARRLSAEGPGSGPGTMAGMAQSAGASPEQDGIALGGRTDALGDKRDARRGNPAAHPGDR